MKKSAIILALAFGVSALTAQDQGAGPPPGDRPPPKDGPQGGPERRPGGFHLLSPRAQEQLNLTADEQKQVAALEVDVKAKLATILTPEQLQQLERPPQRRGGPRGGPGGPGGPIGPGGPDGPAGPAAPGGPAGPGPGPAGPGGLAPQAGPGGALPPEGGPQGAMGPRPGGFHLLPPRAQEQLNLSTDQQKQVGALEVEVKAKLGTILPAEQLKQLAQERPLRRRGGQGGGPGDQGGPGGPGGPPPGDSQGSSPQPLQSE